MKDKRIIEKQKEYIQLLTDELDEVVPIVAAHGWKSTRYDFGKRLRKKISMIESELEVTDEEIEEWSCDVSFWKLNNIPIKEGISNRLFQRGLIEGAKAMRDNKIK